MRAPPRRWAGWSRPTPTRRGRRPLRSWSIQSRAASVAPAEVAAHIALGAQLRCYRFEKYKTKDKPEQKNSLERLTIAVASPAEARKAYAALEPVVDSVFFTRDLVSEPANVLYPVEFARRAKALTKVGLKVEVLGEAADEEARPQRAARRRPGQRARVRSS